MTIRTGESRPGEHSNYTRRWPPSFLFATSFCNPQRPLYNLQLDMFPMPAHLEHTAIFDLQIPFSSVFELSCGIWLTLLHRYPQTCKLCGEVFPKGRMDSMTTHLTKRCPRISESQRISACLALNGISTPRSARSVQQAQQQQQAQQSQHVQQQHSQIPPLDLAMLQSQQGWTPLETLAEVSRRQINHLNGHGEEAGQSQHAMSAGEPMTGIMSSTSTTAPVGPDQFHMQEEFTQEQFVMDSPQSSTEEKPRPQGDQGQFVAESGYRGLSSWNMGMQDVDLTPLTGAMGVERQSSVEDQAHASNDAAHATGEGEAPNLTVAAAATARLNSAGMLDPGLFGSIDGHSEGNLGEELARAIGSVQTGQRPDAAPVLAPSPSAAFQPTVPTASPERKTSTSVAHSPAQTTPTPAFARPALDGATPISPMPHNHSSAPSSLTAAPSAGTHSGGGQLPWGEFTYMSNTATPPTPVRMQPMMGIPSRSVFRVDQNGTKSQHFRSRFTEDRRKEVQRIRMRGACIRCRILRKTCSEGDPCDTCRKVLSPRVWRTGCIRTRLVDELDIYTARVQAYHCSQQVDVYKKTMNLQHPIVVLEATQPGTETIFATEALLGTKPSELYDPTVSEEYESVVRKIIMIDPEPTHQDVPELMQGYVTGLLPDLVRLEEAHFSRITLEAAMEEEKKESTKNKESTRNLRLALELWTYVELIERELKWSYNIRPSPVARMAAKSITRDSDEELYKMLGLQITATAEILAERTSKALIQHLQRDLQDGRAVMGPHVFFTILLLLICVEKSTWAFMSWEKIPELRNQWPLDKQPSYFTGQGDGFAELLRMFLLIRKVLPKTAVREDDGVLVVEEPRSEYHSYFERLNLKGTCSW